MEEGVLIKIAWTCITSHPEKDWGKIIALNLPENDPSNIREKVFSLDLEPLVDVQDESRSNAKQGYDNLIKFMDDEFLKDNITDMCEHIRQFMKLEKKKDEKMKSYVSNFEAAYKKAKEKGLPELPHTYRMYQLLENSKISDNEYMMVLTGISTESKDLYTDAKKSLLKLFNSSRSQGIKKDGGSHIENDPNLDTFWGPATGQRFPISGQRFPTPRIPFMPRPRLPGHLPWRNPNSKQAYQGQRTVSKPLNPIKDGKHLLCNSCGSYRHLAKDCPHRSESQFHQDNQFFEAMGEDEIGDIQYQDLDQAQGYGEFDSDPNTLGEDRSQVREIHFNEAKQENCKPD